MSACTCDGSDHPGPDVGTGRGVPEIDVFEHQIDNSVRRGQMSQSFQVAPFDTNYYFDNSSDVTTIYDDSVTELNSYHGAQYQEAVSALTFTDSQNYNDSGYATYGFEWWSNENNRDEGYIEWSSTGTPAWKITAASVGPDSSADVSQRIIPEEAHVSLFLYFLR